MEAFRKRHEAAGLARREILVQRQTAYAVEALMEAHGASASDVASGIFEFGLKEYLRRYAPSVAAQMDAESAWVFNTAQAAADGTEGDEDPIVAFIRARQRALE